MWMILEDEGPIQKQVEVEGPNLDEFKLNGKIVYGHLELETVPCKTKKGTITAQILHNSSGRNNASCDHKKFRMPVASGYSQHMPDLTEIWE